MKKAFVIVTLSSLLASCTAWAPQAVSRNDMPETASMDENEATDATTAIKNISQPEMPVIPAIPPITDTLPAIELTNELLYKLLSAEIAYQRGHWQTAYMTILAAAHQTRDPRLARRAAEIASSVKQDSEALSAIRLWRELAPHSDEATQYFLSFIVLGNEPQAAQPVFAQRLKEARPQIRGLMMFQIQRMLARTKDKAAGFAILENLLAPYRSTPDAHLALAQGAFAKEDIARAATEARAALSIKPDSELAMLTLAQATPDKNEIVKLFEAFLSAYPNARDIRIAYARILVDQKQYLKARQEFEALLKARPEDLTSLYALGMLSMQADDIDAAEKYLTAYLGILAKQPDEERDPTQALLALAQIAEERKDTDSALKWLSQVESMEAYMGAQIKRAQIIAKRGELKNARALLTELKPKSERDQVQVIAAEAQLLRDANQTIEALEVLETGTKRFPNNADLLYDYAMLAEKSNKIDLMETALRRIIELAPDNQHAYNALGYSLAERNIRLPEAFSLIEKALSLAPDDPFIMDSMGWVQFRLGKLKEAEASLRRAYELRPDPEIAAHLGEVLWTKGQKDDAQKLWRDASKKDPGNDTLKNTLTRLQVSL